MKLFPNSEISVTFNMNMIIDSNGEESVALLISKTCKEILLRILANWEGDDYKMQLDKRIGNNRIHVVIETLNR